MPTCPRLLTQRLVSCGTGGVTVVARRAQRVAGAAQLGAHLGADGSLGVTSDVGKIGFVVTTGTAYEVYMY